ncbi:hypothetical protein MRX96_020647 [Rhipicephalus microplus]
MDMACARPCATEAKARGVMGPYSHRICESPHRHFVRNASRPPRFHGLPEAVATGSLQVRAKTRLLRKSETCSIPNACPAKTSPRQNTGPEPCPAVLRFSTAGVPRPVQAPRRQGPLLF